MFKIKIADLVVRIYNKYEFVKRQCAEYIVPDDTKMDFTVSASTEDINREREIAEGDFSNGYLESICIYRNICRRMPLFDGFLLHAAVAKVDGVAYAFTADSGVGKSTHLRLWKTLLGEKMSIINGDKPIIRVIDGKVFAYGTPWCGKEGFNSNDFAPLKAICFLERGEINKIKACPSNAVLGKLLNQLIISDKPEIAEKLLDLLNITLSNIDLWRLKCNMDISAAKLSYNTMKNGVVK